MEAVVAASQAVHLVRKIVAVVRTSLQKAVVCFDGLEVVRSIVDGPEVIQERSCSGCIGCRNLDCSCGLVVLCLIAVGRNCSLCYWAACRSSGSLATTVDFGLCCKRSAKAVDDEVGCVDLKKLAV